MKGAGLLFLTILLAAGCRQVTPPPDTGTSSFAFVEAPTVGLTPKAAVGEAKAAKSMDDFREAEPINPLATPIYPARALAAKAGAATVGVKILVDAEGRVADVTPSVRTFTTPGRYAEDFFAAVQAAVKQWRFWPARIEHVEFVEAPGLVAYSRVIGTEKMETQFELSFTFTATGGVLGGAPGK